MKSYRVFISLLFILTLSIEAQAQGLGVANAFNDSDILPKTSYTELFLSTGSYSSIGINHIKDLSPRTSILVGASYINFRTSFISNERGYFPAYGTNFRSEMRYFVTPKDQKLTAFVYASINNNIYNFPNKTVYNLGLEVGGEVRYKISENVFFHARTSFYRQSLNGNPFPMDNLYYNNYNR